MAPALLITLAACVAAFGWLAVSLPRQNAVAIALTIVAVCAGFRLFPTLISPNGPILAHWPDRQFWLTCTVAFSTIVSSRGTAKLLLRRLRNSPNSGLLVIALTTLLATVVPSPHWNWRERPVVTPLALVLATTWYIDKRQIDLPPDARPVWIWLTLLVAGLVA